MSDTATLDPVAASATPPSAPTIGAALAGGFYAGRLIINGRPHGLIIAPKAEGSATGIWLPTYTDVPGATSCCDGLANTRAMAAAGSPIAQQALAARIAGYDDWHIMARDALELAYRHLKPTTEANACTFRDGDNPSSVPPGYPYQPQSPSQTSAEAFRAGGPETFGAGRHWSSTQYSRLSAFNQSFGNGDTLANSKDWSGGTVRLARVIPLNP